MSREELPGYVRDAMRGLTTAQKRTLVDGYYGGDNMGLVRQLLDKHLFYIKPNSPNGRWGTLTLTPLGDTVRGVLKSRALASPAASNRGGVQP